MYGTRAHTTQSCGQATSRRVLCVESLCVYCLCYIELNPSFTLVRPTLVAVWVYSAKANPTCCVHGIWESLLVQSARWEENILQQTKTNDTQFKKRQNEINVPCYTSDLRPLATFQSIYASVCCKAGVWYVPTIATRSFCDALYHSSSTQSMNTHTRIVYVQYTFTKMLFCILSRQMCFEEKCFKVGKFPRHSCEHFVV